MEMILCPNCKAILQKDGKTMKCQKGHSFDFAKEGYVNLLLANQKKKNEPGDNKKMLNAREEILSTGIYKFLIDHIESSFETLNLFEERKEELCLLDLGCGTGYYTRNLFRDKEIKKIGLDISKAGVAKAASKDKDSVYIVSSVFNIPLTDDSINLLLNVFSPLDYKELERVLKPGGYFVKVVPKGNHMKEVAELVYDKFIPHQSNIKQELALNPKFQVIKVDHLENKISLSGQDLLNFISMTPYLYKFKKEQLDALDEMSVSISFEIVISRFDF